MTPEELKQRLLDLHQNMWWTWSHSAQALFAEIDPNLWEGSNHNPAIGILVGSPARMAALANDKEFVQRLRAVEAELRKYLRNKTWFKRESSARERKLRVAYFCSEYALHESMPQYAGGLGVLAGDHLKAASDLGIPLVGVGLLYRHGYYRQELTQSGETRALYPNYAWELWPLQDTGKVIECPFAGRTIAAKVWKLEVGRVPLYLLDTDIEQNRTADRGLTAGLYRGAPEARMKQQILLGVGGMIALNAVGEKPNMFHLNEGHAAFVQLERMRRGESLEQIRQKSVFTTHTPVPAGHDRYPIKSAAKWLRPVLQGAALSVRDLTKLGNETPGQKTDELCMTVLALNTSNKVNGVSALHGAVSREMWQSIYSTEQAAEVPIGHVTNGVHLRTWMSPTTADFYQRKLKVNWLDDAPDADWWKRLDKVSDEEIYDLRSSLRSELVHFVRTHNANQAQRRGASAAEVAAAREVLDEDTLTIGFARRFATYKRAPLIFRDLKRLENILCNSQRPVQLVFAGKAHPDDTEGQAFAQKIFKMTQRPAFRGKVVLLEDYDMRIGRMLTSGCDVWLNTPVRPHEASGTSGMKPTLHGGLNLSILDGWWPEAINRHNGWAIGSEVEYRSRVRQDREDANSLYELLESEVAPLFYKTNRAGISKAWAKKMRASMQSVPRGFRAARMLSDYLKRYYL